MNKTFQQWKDEPELSDLDNIRLVFVFAELFLLILDFIYLNKNKKSLDTESFSMQTADCNLISVCLYSVIRLHNS